MRRDVPGVARRQYFPSPSDEYLSVRALPPELERGTFCRTCALQPAWRFSCFYQAALTFRVRTARAFAARATILSLSLPFALVLSTTTRSIPLCWRASRINRTDSSRELESLERYLSLNRRDFER